MKLHLSTKASEKLAQHAQLSGKDVAAITSDLIEQAIAQPSLKEFLATSQAEFASTGMSENQLLEFGRQLLEKVRDERTPQA